MYINNKSSVFKLPDGCVGQESDVLEQNKSPVTPTLHNAARVHLNRENKWARGAGLTHAWPVNGGRRGLGLSGPLCVSPAKKLVCRLLLTN